MANILKHKKPWIADIECTRLKFEPGDRILVRTYQKLDKDQEKRLKRSIQKWAGVEVEILIINVLELDINVESGYRPSGSLVGR